MVARGARTYGLGASVPRLIVFIVVGDTLLRKQQREKISRLGKHSHLCMVGGDADPYSAFVVGVPADYFIPNRQTLAPLSLINLYLTLRFFASSLCVLCVKRLLNKNAPTFLLRRLYRLQG